MAAARPASKKGRRDAPGESPPDLKAMARDLEEAVTQLGKDVRAAVARAAEETQYELDKGFAKALASHPELYADIRRTMRQAKKTVEDAAKVLGLDSDARQPRK